jgi:hypothetical protein
MKVLLLLARGAYAGLALFGAVVVVLGGASLRLGTVFWLVGIAAAWVKDSWVGWREQGSWLRRSS